MASSAAGLPLFLLLTLLSSLHTHARDSQFFNKIPSTTNNVVVPNNNEVPNAQQQQQEPNFLPESENGYGLYGHESGQNPPSTAATTTPENTEFKEPEHKYLPKNYNPVAYVTQPEDVNENTAFTEERSFTTNPNNNNNNYYNNNQQQQQQEGETQEEAKFRSYPTTTANNNNRDNFYYNGGNSFNSQPQGESKYYNYDGANGFQPQGMSDTRFMADGKYHYDIKSGKYSRNHPYETLRAQNDFNTRNFYSNNANQLNSRDFYAANDFNTRNFGNNAANEFNSGNNFNELNNRNYYTNNANDFNAEEFQNEENLP